MDIIIPRQIFCANPRLLEGGDDWKNLSLCFIIFFVVSRPKKRKSRAKRFVGYFLVSFFLLLATGGVWSSYIVVRNLPDPRRLSERPISQSTKIYDRTGEIVLYEIHGDERRTVVRLSEIPKNMQNATIAAEDVNFYTHIGLDWRGIVRAFVKNLLSGDIRQGGSTITQQLVKKAILSDERTYTRKFKEALLALSIETVYSKDEILEFYLNQIPYGSNAYGVSAAAQIYFSKPVADLTLAESAILASLVKAPTYYFSRKEELLERKNSIIDRMREQGLITGPEAAAAKKENVLFSLHPQSIIAPHFVLYVRDLLSEKYGEEFVEAGGLRVVTSLDAGLQKKAEAAVAAGAERNEPLGVYNASLVAINPKTGEILAMVGSRSYWDAPKPQGCVPGVSCKFDPHVNVSLRARQPGSAFKPFVYATAFKKGYTPETVLLDVPTEFNPRCTSDGTPGPALRDPETCYHPQNYDKKFLGPVSLREALAQSRNVPSVKLLYLARIQDSIETASAAGITTLTDPDRYGLSLVLGGAEVTLLEMTSAFGVFAQDGILYPKTAILRVEDAKGKILEEQKPRGSAVLDTQTARLITDILSDNVARTPVFGPTSALFFPDRTVAVKTGTTQDYRDAWVVGYTPSIVAGVWVGNNDNSTIDRERLSAMVAAPIWHEFLTGFFETSPPEDFVPPEKENPEKPVLRGVYRAGPIVKIDSLTGRLVTDFTPPELVREKAYGPLATILMFINKEDPLGNPPENPWSDPQYKNWQEGVRSWASQNAPREESPPTTVDTVHAPENQPKISFPSLPPGGVSPLSPREIEVNVSAVFSLREVSFFVDDVLRGAKTAPPLGPSSFPLPTPLLPGSHTLRAVAYDVFGNKGVEEVSLTILSQ